MNIKNAKDYLKNLQNNIIDEGEEKEKISALSLIYILTRFLEALEED